MFNQLIKLTAITLLFISFASCKHDHGYKSITDCEIKAFYKDLPFEMPVLKVPQFKKYSVKITDFGAIGDGVTLNTDAFAKAIDQVHAKGGGRVIVPRGIFLTGPIVMKSNVNLFLERNSMILFSSDFDLYPIVDASFEGLNTKRCQSPISAHGAENIAITGYGVIDGSGDAWRPTKREKLTDRQWRKLVNSGGVTDSLQKIWYPSESSIRGQAYCVDQNVPVGLQTDEEWAAIRDFLRPVLLNFVKCKNILLEGVTFQNSPAWNLHPLMSENIIINRLTVRNPRYSQNGDGVDIESCKNTLIVNSSFDVGDDAICMKSGKNETGRARAMPTENVIVANCVVYHGHGGFVVGSEMSGDVRNISVKHCSFIGTDVGLRFKSNRGRGGVVENIWISHINMINIPTDPLTFNLYYGGKSAIEAIDAGDDPSAEAAKVPPVTIETPAFRNIFISDIVSNGSNRPMYFNGLPEMKVENVVIENSIFNARYGAEISRAKGVTISNVILDVENGEALVLEDVDGLNISRLTDPAGNKIIIRQKGTNNNLNFKD